MVPLNVQQISFPVKTFGRHILPVHSLAHVAATLVGAARDERDSVTARNSSNPSTVDFRREKNRGVSCLRICTVSWLSE